MPVRRATLVTVLVLLLCTALPGSAERADAYPGAPWFRPGQPYTGNFPDPHVVRDGSRFVAYGTATGGSYLPVMTSSDLRTWVARPAYDPGPPHNSDRFFNDALPEPAAWGYDRGGSGRMTKEVWAPGVARIGGAWRAYYTVRLMPGSPGRMCISVASATDALGPFTDRTTGPLVCDPDQAGSIDPSPFVDADGTPYLLWKSEGVPGQVPTRLWARRLSSDGLSFAAGTEPVELARTTQGWEGTVVENPSMVRHAGRYLLFYSANEHRSADYAVGWAECAGPLGPCQKRSTASPLLASHGERLGPGGASAFEDADGRLWLAYHWWNAPHTSYPAHPECEQAGTCTSQGQRRMAVERVHVQADGSLRVGDQHPLGGPAASMAAGPDGGYLVVAANGAVAALGTPFHGSMADTRLTRPVTGVGPTPTGRGYWLVASDGGIFAFGDATFHGSTGNIALNQPIVGMAPTPTGRGYWLAASDGGIFAFGDATFHGSTGNIALNQPIVGMAPTPTGRGYWLAASDGGIFAFGDATFHGSTGHLRLASPIRSMATPPGGGGYWMLGADGGIFAFGDARYQGRARI